MPPLAAGIGAAAIGTAASAGAISLGTALALTFALQLGVYVLTPKPKRLTSSGLDRLQTERSTNAPRRWIFGEARVGGTVAFIAQDDNHWLHAVIVLAGHPCQSVSNPILDGGTAVLDVNGDCVSGNFSGAVHQEVLLGTHSATWASLIAAWPTVWTANHKLLGCTSVYLKLKTTHSRFQGGIPSMVWDVVGHSKVLDTRGTPIEAYRSNPALCVGQHLRERLGDPVNAARLSASANVCDELVPLAAGGTAQRYICNGAFQLDQTHADILQSLLSSMAGSIRWSRGEWHVYAGAWRAPELELGLDDARSPLSITTRISRRELFNGVKGVFADPLRSYQAVAYQPYVNSTYRSQDDDEELFLDLDQAFVNDNITCQRLAKIELERARQQIKVVSEFSLGSYKLEAGDTVNLRHPRLGWNPKTFEVSDADLVSSADGLEIRTRLTLRETAPEVWDWNSGEETDYDIAPDTTLPDPFTMPTPTGLTLLSDDTTALETQDGIVQPRIKVSWTAVNDPYLTRYDVEYKRNDLIAWQRMPGVITQLEAFIVGLQLGYLYNVRVRATSTIGIVSAWATGDVLVSSRSSLFDGRLAPRLGGNPTNMVTDGGFFDQDNFRTLASTLETAVVATVDDGIPAEANVGFSDLAKAHNGNAADYAFGAFSRISGVNSVCGYRWGWASGSGRGRLRINARAYGTGKYLGNGQLFYKIGSDPQVQMAYTRASSRPEQEAFYSPDLGTQTLANLKVIALGSPSSAGANAGQMRVHEIAFMTVLPPYGSVGGGKGTVIGDGTLFGWIRQPIGAAGRAVLRGNMAYVAVLAARRGEAGQAPTAPLKFRLENQNDLQSATLLQIAAADIIDAWRYYAICLTVGSSLRGDVELVWETTSTKPVDIDQATLVRGRQIPDFETSLQEYLTGSFGDDESAPLPLVWTAGDWVPGVYKIAETV